MIKLFKKYWHSLKTKISAWINRLPALRFFGLAFGLSWLFWLPATFVKQDIMTFPWLLLLIGGGLGPALAEIILIFRSSNRQERRDYWQRVFDIRRISGRWHAVIWLTFPVLNVMALLLVLWGGGQLPEFELARRFLAAPLAILPYALFMLLFGPLPEELGWRGYALDALQLKWNALTASLVLGVLWTLWHLPLFFMAGTFQSEQLGLGTPAFWAYCLSTVLSSILFTWIYNNTNRSTLSAILFHFMVNFSGELFALNEQARLYQALLLIPLILAVVIIWGPETLTGQRQLQNLQRATISGKRLHS